MLDFFPPEAAEQLQRQVDEIGDGWRLPFPGFEQLAIQANVDGLGDAERELMARKAAPQPFRTYTEPLRLPRGAAGSYDRVVIACDETRTLIESGEPSVTALAAPPWHRFDIATGHWPMLSAPEEVVSILHGLAAGR